MKVLLSIKPKYADKIFSGEKKWEYRKKIWKRNIKTVVVYASAPRKEVIGEFKITPINRSGSGLNLGTIWYFTRDHAGITYKEFCDYFKGKLRGQAIQVISYTLYDNPKPLSDYGIKRPPQNFMYLSDDTDIRGLI